ncbi:MAG: hypothetical protein ACREDR_47440, partial [Blastocatellia bacterium]
CLVCGSSKWDPDGYKCGLCGAAMGPRTEECYVSEDTKRKLLEHRDEMARFGIKIKQHERLQKHVDKIAATSLALQVAELVRPGTVRDVVHFLLDLAVPKSEILTLRLDEPEQILSYIRTDSRRG